MQDAIRLLTYLYRFRNKHQARQRAAKFRDGHCCLA